MSVFSGYAVVCGRAVIDETSQNVTLVDVIETLNVDFKNDESDDAGFIVPIELTIVSTLYYTGQVDAEPATVPYTVEWRAPDHGVQSGTSNSVHFSERKKTRLFISIENLRVRVPGLHRFVGIFEDEKLFEIPVLIRDVSEEMVSDS
jgi:hypothetical protein